MMSNDKISLGPEVWQRVFGSPLFQQTTTLLRQIFKRSFGVGSLTGITYEEFARIRDSSLKYDPIHLPFCNLVGKTEEGIRRCRMDRKQSWTRVSTTGQVETFTCHAGLTATSIPIMFRGKYCGVVSATAGFLLHEPNQAEWNQIAERVKDTGVNLEALKKAYFEITPISKDLLDVMIRLLGVVVEEIIKAAVESEEDKKRIAHLETALYEKYRFANIIGQSKPMTEVFQLMEDVIETDSPVLIQGETGTGKELVARAVHFNGPRKDKPFLPQNCAAVNESLLEAELFGHTKGAFTGALKDHRGLFELADGGTVFLDEIAEMSPQMQAKLLRVVEQGEFKRVGDEKISKVDVRIISATNKDLKTLIREGKFREDLYYRVKGFLINLPPLRKRKEDIPLLVEHFLEKYTAQTSKRLELAPEVLRLLTDYAWPGNVRELENEVKRIVTLSKNKKMISADVLSREIRNSVRRIRHGDPWEQFQGKTLQELEKELIIRALKEVKGNKAKAAKILGIPKTSLYNKIARYKIK